MKIFTKKQHKKDVREMNGEEIMKPIWELLYLDRWGKGKDNDELIKVIEKTLAIKEEQKDELLDFLENETKIKEVLIRQLQEQLKQRTDEILGLIEKYKKKRGAELMSKDTFGKETYIRGKYDMILEFSEELRQKITALKNHSQKTYNKTEMGRDGLKPTDISDVLRDKKGSGK